MTDLYTVVVVSVAMFIVVFAGFALAFDTSAVGKAYCNENGCRRLVDYSPDTNSYCGAHAMERDN